MYIYIVILVKQLRFKQTLNENINLRNNDTNNCSNLVILLKTIYLYCKQNKNNTNVILK